MIAAPLLLFGVLAAVGPALALETVDDLENRVALQGPAGRIVTLSPHATELALAAGLADRLVAISLGREPPAAVADLPRLGGFGAIDRELLLRLEPDLVIAWHSGNRPQDIAWIERSGIAVYRSEPRTMTELVGSIRRLGRLGGTATAANRQAAALQQRLATPCTQLERLPVYVEVWHRPAMTMGGAHWLNSVLDAAGYRNVFGGFARGVFAVAEEPRLAVSTLPVISLVPTGEDALLAEQLSIPGTGIFDAMETLCERRLSSLRRVTGPGQP